MIESAAAALSGCRVWVTRPRGQAQALCELIQGAGGAAVEFPLTEIVPAPDQDAARTALAQIAQHDIGIFISRNAVRYALDLEPALVNVRGKCQLFAVGAGTAAELSRFRIGAVTGPGPAYGSADLLTLPQLQAEVVRGRSVLIIRGTGGEENLRSILEQRGAVVRYAEVYQRRRPDHDANQLQLLWRQTPPDVIVLTSVSAVRALLDLTPAEQHARLLQSALVVISDRVCSTALRAGFTGTVLVAAGTTDSALFQTLLLWRCN